MSEHEESGEEEIIDAEIVPPQPAAHSTELAVAPRVGSTELIQAGNAKERVVIAAEIATELDKIIKSQGMRTKVGRRRVEDANGREVWVDGWHVNVEGWQTLATFLGIAPVPVWTRKVMDPVTGTPELVSYDVIEKAFYPKKDGGGVKSEKTYTVEGYSWEARVEIFKDGVLVGAGESMCSRTEKKWKESDDFAVRSMAQTRAMSRAIGSAARWIVTLAGYSGTPAEEMDAKAAQQEATNPEEKWGPGADAKQVGNARKALAYLLGVEPGDQAVGPIADDLMKCGDTYYPVIFVRLVLVLARAVRSQHKKAAPGEGDPAGETAEEFAERERGEALVREHGE